MVLVACRRQQTDRSKATSFSLHHTYIGGIRAFDSRRFLDEAFERLDQRRPLQNAGGMVLSVLLRILHRGVAGLGLSLGLLLLLLLRLHLRLLLLRFPFLWLAIRFLSLRP